jgi:cytidyltransferase-like protein
MKKVMVFGTFDVLHEGHRNFFQQARQYGDYVVCVVARDSTTRHVGKNVLQDENQRLQNVISTGLVDKAVLGNEGDKYQVILEHQPDIICLGYDQSFFTHGLQTWLDKNSLSAQIIRLEPYEPEKFKSSLIRARILNERK